ncbi:MAG: hypothetical protein IID17_12670, partial [Nitrospinae bacterium]|nr:hypothetical protein [Nitrospinota bacterium]
MEGDSLRRLSGSLQKILLVIFILILIFPGNTFSEEPNNNRQRPTFSELSLEELVMLEVILVNVLGTHTHLESEWMVGYQFRTMNMGGNRSGRQDLSTSEVLSLFPVAPLAMTMDMHMPMVMYAPTDHITMMAMIPYVRKVMDHITRTGVRFTTQSEGWGDLQLTVLYTVYGNPGDTHRLALSGGFSVPTGSIKNKDFLASPSLGKFKFP